MCYICWGISLGHSGSNPFHTMILACINQKGGVGKTTTAINLSVAIAGWGQPVLLVDLDPQGNATSGVGLRGPLSPTLYEVMVEADTPDNGGHTPPGEPAVARGPVPLLSVVGADPQLAGSEVELSGNDARDNLRRVLKRLEARHPLIVLDTPPSLSLLTVNALVAADQLVIPVQCEYFALEGLGHLLRTLELIKRKLNPDLKVMGLLRTMFDSRLGLSTQVSRELETHFPQLLFKTIVPRNVRLAEAPSHGQPIALYDRRSPGADAYRRLALEVMERAGLREPEPTPTRRTRR